MQCYHYLLTHLSIDTKCRLSQNTWLIATSNASTAILLLPQTHVEQDVHEVVKLLKKALKSHLETFLSRANTTLTRNL